jgi:RHS repeat-associated protein
VQTVINDHIKPLDEDHDNVVDGYQVGIGNIADYSPFGVQLDGRTLSHSADSMEVCVTVTDSILNPFFEVDFDNHPPSWTMEDTTQIFYKYDDGAINFSNNGRLQLDHSTESSWDNTTIYVGIIPNQMIQGTTYLFSFDLDLNQCSLDSVLFFPNLSDGIKLTSSGHVELTFTETENNNLVAFTLHGENACTAYLDNFKIQYFSDTTYNVCNRVKSNDGYRYGYQGSEADDEVKGPGNSYTTEFRQLDPRLGRWLSIDPVTHPWQSPYCSMDNNPIWHNDPLGLWSEKQAERKAGRMERKGYENVGVTETIDKEGKGTGNFGVRTTGKEDGSGDGFYFEKSGNKGLESGRAAKAESGQQTTSWASNGSPFLANFRSPGKFDFNHTPIDFPKTYDIAGPLANIFSQTFTMIGTGGVGAEIGVIKAGLMVGSISGGANYTGQMIANNFDNSKVDFAGVGIAFGSGFVSKSPTLVVLTAAGLDAMVDYSSSVGFNYVGKKDWRVVGNDFLWNSLGNSGAASFGKTPLLFQATGTFVTSVPTTVINTVTDNQISPPKP